MEHIPGQKWHDNSSYIKPGRLSWIPICAVAFCVLVISVAESLQKCLLHILAAIEHIKPQSNILQQGAVFVDVVNRHEKGGGTGEHDSWIAAVPAQVIEKVKISLLVIKRREVELLVFMSPNYS